MDFQQGLITTVHEYGLAKSSLELLHQGLKRRKTAILIPCLYEEFSRPALSLIREVLQDLKGLELLVVALSARSSEEASKAKDFFAKQRFFSPVLVRGEEDQGVRVWGYGKMAYEKLLTIVLDPDYGDITDPENGNDLKLMYGKLPGASFPRTDIRPRPRKTTNRVSLFSAEPAK